MLRILIRYFTAATTTFLKISIGFPSVYMTLTGFVFDMVLVNSSPGKSISFRVPHSGVLLIVCGNGSGICLDPIRSSCTRVGK